MKYLVLILSLVSATAFGAKKVCFYAGGNYGSKGDFFVATVSAKTLTVKPIKGEAAWEGTFNISKWGPVAGRDGKTYLNFDAHLEEGCTTILVDQGLTQLGTVGMIKFQCRGEGYNLEKFMCRDDRQQ